MIVKNESHTFSGRVWEWEGKGAWHFVTIEKTDASLLKSAWVWPRKGFGSIPVVVEVGKTSWQTSIFPQKGGTYLLPLKKAVREKENIKIGQTVTFKIQVIS